MQIVIDIDEDTYTDIKKGKVYSSTRDVPQESVLAIANGTPLPEGHGRLIDADIQVSEIKDLKKSPWYKDNTNFAYLPRKEAVEIIEELIVGNAPTIVETDKEAEDGTNIN